MEMSDDDFCEIIAPNWPHELNAKLSSFSHDWCKWAKAEISSGVGVKATTSTLQNETSKLFTYFLRVLNVAQIVYIRTMKGIPIYLAAYDIVTKALEYCEIAEGKAAIDLSNRLHSLALQSNYLEKVDDYFLRLSFKGKKVLRSIPGFTEPPSIMNTAAERQQVDKDINNAGEPDNSDSIANANNKLIQGTVMLELNGDLVDGDAVLKCARIALKGARTSTPAISFASSNKQHEAAKRLLVFVAGANGRFMMNDIKGICQDIRLANSVAGHVRDALDNLICRAAGLPTKGKGNPKAFAYDGTRKDYYSLLEFKIADAISS